MKRQLIVIPKEDFVNNFDKWKGNRGKRVYEELIQVYFETHIENYISSLTRASILMKES